MNITSKNIKELFKTYEVIEVKYFISQEYERKYIVFKIGDDENPFVFQYQEWTDLRSNGGSYILKLLKEDEKGDILSAAFMPKHKITDIVLNYFKNKYQIMDYINNKELINKHSNPSTVWKYQNYSKESR